MFISLFEYDAFKISYNTHYVLTLGLIKHVRHFLRYGCISLKIEGMLRKSDVETVVTLNFVHLCKSCLAFNLLLNFMNLQR